MSMIKLAIKIMEYQMHIISDQSRFNNPDYRNVWLKLNKMDDIVNNKAKFTNTELKDLLNHIINHIYVDLEWWECTKKELCELVNLI